jgi:glutathione S-transferase
MLTLYGAFRSRATRPLWLLYECGAEFRHVPVLQAYRLADPHAPDAPMNTASPAFLALNPQGQVPAMEDDGLVLSESLAICLHIARRHGGPLGPQTEAELSLAEQWALYAATGLEPPGIRIFYCYRDGIDGTEAGQAIVAAAADELARPLARLEAALQGQDWLMGGRFTVADVMVAECLRYAMMHPPLAAARPVAKAWLDRCQARPAFQRMWAERAAEAM